MISKQYTDEFKAEAVKQVTKRGYPVAEVAKRLGVSSHSLYEWLRKAKNAAHAGGSDSVLQSTAKDSAEVRRLKAELKRVTEERDSLNGATRRAVPECLGNSGRFRRYAQHSS